MSKLGDELIASMEQALAHAKGQLELEETRVEVPANEVRAARLKLGLSQNEFAKTFHVSAATVRTWEQGRRQAEGPARVLLKVIVNEPQAVKRALKV